ncbi:MAG TPA: hypothetical protein VFH16_07450, partial [Rubrobacter sp.]|nr:hypothetical protein [Rubrobacter sp.]
MAEVRDQNPLGFTLTIAFAGKTAVHRNDMAANGRVFKVSHQGKSSEGRNYSNKEQHEKKVRHPLRYRSRLGIWRYGVQ